MSAEPLHRISPVPYGYKPGDKIRIHGQDYWLLDTEGHLSLGQTRPTGRGDALPPGPNRAQRRKARR